jgi:predicted RNase H-like HicB family nuclease
MDTLQSNPSVKSLATIKEAIELVLEIPREELRRKSPAHRREISRVEMADVA